MRFILTSFFLVLLVVPARADACLDDPTRDCLLDRTLAATDRPKFNRELRAYLRGRIGALRNDDKLIEEALQVLRNPESGLRLEVRVQTLSEMARIAGNARWFREALAIASHASQSDPMAYGIIARGGLAAGLTPVAAEAFERLARIDNGATWFVLGPVYTYQALRAEDAFAMFMQARGVAAGLDFIDRHAPNLAAQHRRNLVMEAAMQFVELKRFDEAMALRATLGRHDDRDRLAVQIGVASGRVDAKSLDGLARRIGDESARFHALAVIAAALRDPARIEELMAMSRKLERPGWLLPLAVEQTKAGQVEDALRTISAMGETEKSWQAEALLDVAVAAKRVDLASRALKSSYAREHLEDYEFPLLMRRAEMLWR